MTGARCLSRALFAWTVGALFLAVATPAAAKPTFDEARINGPGLGGRGVHIAGRAIAPMTESGIDLANGRGYAMVDSIAELGLTAAELGPGYVVRYSFYLGRSKPPRIVRQELYPYAKGGPVTYTSPGQRLGGPASLSITAGWYRGSAAFLDFLVDQGLPETNPMVVADRAFDPDTAPSSGLWRWIAVAFAAVLALAVVSGRLRRRLLAVARLIVVVDGVRQHRRTQRKTDRQTVFGSTRR
jgi:hypothetical protein